MSRFADNTSNRGGCISGAKVDWMTKAAAKVFQVLGLRYVNCGENGYSTATISRIHHYLYNLNNYAATYVLRTRKYLGTLPTLGFSVSRLARLIGGVC